MKFSFSETVLGKYDVSYFHCRDCGFLRTEDPYWLDEAYAKAISAADTGLLERNLAISARLAAILYLCFDARSAFVDVAGGYGTLTRLMRDIGFDFYWEDKYCENLLAIGFEADKAGPSIRALTAFEVLEHVPDPLNFVSDLMRRFGTGNVIFCTEVYRGPSPVRPYPLRSTRRRSATVRRRPRLSNSSRSRCCICVCCRDRNITVPVTISGC
jgi:hypothetical protein